MRLAWRNERFIYSADGAKAQNPGFALGAGGRCWEPELRLSKPPPRFVTEQSEQGSPQRCAGCVREGCRLTKCPSERTPALLNVAVRWGLGEGDLITNIGLDGCAGITALRQGGRDWPLLFTHALILILPLLPAGWSCSFSPQQSLSVFRSWPAA